jgi:hypothetical protein
MSSVLHAAPAPAGTGPAATEARRLRARFHRRAVIATAGVTIASLALLADLLLVGHTVGEELWGPVSAAIAAGVGLLSLAYLAARGRSRVARGLLYALWVFVAFLGVGGYNDHRLPRPADTITDQRERPPLAPLAFVGLAVVGAVALRSGSKGA